jgi:cytochrome c556
MMLKLWTSSEALAAVTALALVAVVGLTGCSDEPKDTHPDQLVTKRSEVFKQFGKTLEPMGLVARDRQPYNPREFNVNAEELNKLASQPWGYFTPDSNYPPTRAKPEVWTKAADFKAAQVQYQLSTQQLLKASQSGDLDAIRPAVDNVQKSCKSCHDSFRNAR